MSHAISDVTHNTRVHGSAAPGSARAFQSYIYHYIAMSAKSLLCRPHWASVPYNKVTSIFITNSLEREWPSRISALVNIPVNGSDQFPHHVCSMCLMQDIILEKASVNLATYSYSWNVYRYIYTYKYFINMQLPPEGKHVEAEECKLKRQFFNRTESCSSAWPSKNCMMGLRSWTSTSSA